LHFRLAVSLNVGRKALATLKGRRNGPVSGTLRARCSYRCTSAHKSLVTGHATAECSRNYHSVTPLLTDGGIAHKA
jgi:hypothetical protein